MSARKLNQRSPAGRRSRASQARAVQINLCYALHGYGITDDRTARGHDLPMMKEADFQPPVVAREAGRPRWSTAASTAAPSAATPAPAPCSSPSAILVNRVRWLSETGGRAGLSSPEHRFGGRVRTYVLCRNQGNQAPLEIGEGGSEMTNELACIFVFTFYFARV